MLFIFGGLAVFGLALGISRGFPAGEPVPMDCLLYTSRLAASAWVASARWSSCFMMSPVSLV